MLWGPDPVLGDVPSSDGAAAGDLEQGGWRRQRNAAWILGTAMRSGADDVRTGGNGEPLAGQPGAPTTCSPRRASDRRRRDRRGRDVRAVLVVRARGSRTQLRGQGRLEAHRRTGSPPGRRPAVRASGGVLSTNPIGASGMLPLRGVGQVRGQAGEHQIDGARAWPGSRHGGGSQFFAMGRVLKQAHLTGLVTRIVARAPGQPAPVPQSPGERAGNGA